MLTVDGIPVFPIFGGTQPVQQGGYASSADLVTHTADGVDLNDLWDIAAAGIELHNAQQQVLIDLLTFPVETPVEVVPQIGEMSFDELTEYGIPTTAQQQVEMWSMGYDLKHYGKRLGYTWMFLADADARQINALHNGMLLADRRLVFRKIMEALFDNRIRRTNIRNQPYNVFPLYNGVDVGIVPPSYKGNTFTATHNHYLTSGNTTIDSSDVEDLYTLIEEHGYGLETGATFFLLANKAQTTHIRNWRRGAVTANGVTATYDFIPAANQPAMMLPNAEGLLGTVPPDSYRGMRVIGSYGDIYIIEESYIPPGYLLMVGSGGAGNLGNPVGLRQHVNPAMQGLRILPGNQQRFPLVDSFYAHSFGTGIRQRGGAAIMQLGTGDAGAYQIPAKYRKGSGLLA
jgi:hypothetical protein